MLDWLFQDVAHKFDDRKHSIDVRFDLSIEGLDVLDDFISQLQPEACTV